MFKVNGNYIYVYVVIRGSYGNDIILKNITKDKIKCLGHFKNYNRAVNECKKIEQMLKFLDCEANNEV